MSRRFNWLLREMIPSAFLAFFISFHCNAADLNVVSAQRFIECVSSMFSRYPFITEPERLRLGAIVQKSSHVLQKNPTREKKEREVRLFGKHLASLVLINDTWRDTREIAFISTLEGCSQLITRASNSELLMEVMASIPNYGSHNLFNFTNRTPKLFSSKSDEAALLLDYSTTSKHRFKRDLESSNPSQQEVPAQSFPNIAIQDVLMQSSTFRKVFQVGVTQDDASILSSVITEAGLDGYSVTVINDAKNAVSKTMSSMNISSNSENYAFAISQAIATVLQLHNLTSLADGAQIANNMIRKLEFLLPNQNPGVQLPEPQNANVYNTELETDGKLISTQVNVNQVPQINTSLSTSMIQPFSEIVSQTQNRTVVFENKLASFLSQSPEMLSLFCKGTAPNVFQVVKKGMSDFGMVLSTKAAMAASGAFAEMSPEQDCSQYAVILSTALAKVLLNSGVLDSSDASEISRKLVSSVADSAPASFAPLSPDTQSLVEDSGVSTALEISLPADQQLTPNQDKSNLNSMSQNSAFTNTPIIESLQVTFPKSVNKALIFESNLTSLLSQSRELSNLFCEGAIPNIFQAIKKGFSDFGLTVSLKIAITATSAFADLNPEQACSKYAILLSTTISDVLFSNDFKESVDPSEIVEKLVSGTSSDSEKPIAVTSSSNTQISSNYPTSSISEVPLLTNQQYDFSLLMPNSEILPSRSLNSTIQMPNSLHSFTGSSISTSENVTPLLFPNSFLATETQTQNKLQLTETNNINDATNTPGNSFPPPTISKDDKEQLTDAYDFIRTFMDFTEFSTTSPDPYVKHFADAIDDPITLSELLMDEIKYSLRALTNSGSSNGNIACKAKYFFDDDKSDTLTPISSNIQDGNLLDTKKCKNTMVTDFSRSQPIVSSAVNQDSASNNVLLPSPAFTSQSESIPEITFNEFKQSFVSIPQQPEYIQTRNSELAENLLSISESSLTFIQSPNFKVLELCDKLNDLAALVSIQPVSSDICSESALNNYLLHILIEVAYKLKGAR